MIPHEIRERLQNIINGARFEGPTGSCAAVRNLLVESFGTSSTVKSEFESKAIVKEKQASFLKAWAEKTGLWLDNLPIGSEYLTKGGESKIYLAPDKLNVIKLNDSVYYATWDEYLNSLLLHNLLNIGDGLSIVLRQPFIEGEQAQLDDIKVLLSYNGFENTRWQDYYNREFSLILEDMHDENVIAKDGLLFFIDTVFYIMKKSIID